MCRKKKRNSMKRLPSGVDREQSNNVEMNQYPLMVPSLGNNMSNISSDPGSATVLQTCNPDGTGSGDEDNDGFCLVDNVLYESCEINRPDDLRPSASHRNQDEHTLAASGKLEVQHILCGENEYATVNTGIPKEKIVESALSSDVTLDSSDSAAIEGLAYAGI